MLSTLMITVYAAIALFSATMTYFEQQQKSQQNVMYKALGFFACAIWPVTVVAVVIAAKSSVSHMGQRQVSAFKDV